MFTPFEKWQNGVSNGLILARSKAVTRLSQQTRPELADGSQRTVLPGLSKVRIQAIIRGHQFNTKYMHQSILRSSPMDVTHQQALTSPTECAIIRNQMLN